jgi:ATP-dependent phosphoenolpyruvate carboxykinase
MVYPIHKNIFDKKSTLFVYGVSNTGKTTLVGTPVQNYFGSENVGWVVSTKNFK